MDPDLDVAARTLRLLTLLQTRPTWTAAELSDRTGVSPRTLRRDLHRLTQLGYEVQSQPGPGGHYRLAAGTRLPPMTFDEDEVVALVAGLRMAEQGAAGEAATRALTKLRQVLPRRLAALADDVATQSQALLLDGTEETVGDTFRRLTSAAAARLAVRFTYTDQHGRTTQRHAESLRCLLLRGRWTLLAWDPARSDWRVFRLDRIEDVVTDGESPHREPPAADLTEWVLTDFGRKPA